MLRMHQHRSAEATRSYYTGADYYTDEARGTWIGRGAERLGLVGEVDPLAFDDLCFNRHPQTGERLTSLNAADRTVSYDFNFHPPKSFSVLRAIAGDERLREALEASVCETIAALEVEMKTRVRRGGVDEERVTGNLVGAVYTHSTSRPIDGVPDPHTHVHVVVFNATYDQTEAKWKAGQFRDLKRDAPYFEAFFHSQLAKKVADLGYEVERTAKGWEIAGVSNSVVKAFSRRTAEIERLAAEKGITNSEEKDQLGAKSRQGKIKELAPAALRELWTDRIGPAEVERLEALHRQADGHTTAKDVERAAGAALDYAVAHCFERDSVVTEKHLLEAALRRSFGQIDAQSVQSLAGKRPNFIRGIEAGQGVVTTREVLAEEQRMVAFARDGRGTCAALGGPEPPAIQRDFLNADQRAAVRHLLTSPDRVMLVRGKAGVGKTTTLREAVDAIEANGRRVFAFAPSADASRGTLRIEGFSEADTVATLLANPRLHDAIEGQVLLIDEAGMLGTRVLAAVFDLAREQNARVILVGDTAQHRAVERGAALRVLEEQAGCEAAAIRDIQRQKGAYKDAVAALAEGRTLEGFQRLDDLGWVTAIPDAASRDQALAERYAALAAKGQKTLIIAPTRAEGARITAAVRDELRQSKRLVGDDANVLRLNATHWTEAERRDSIRYQVGDVIQYVQNAKGHRRGERLTVLAADDGSVRVADAQGHENALGLDQANRFQVYRGDQIPLAPGDALRITLNGKSRDGHTLNNGSLYRLAGFTPDGDLRLDNGWIVNRQYGHFSHGYVVTSHASQGKTVDWVLVGQSAASGRAASAEQFYVSASRAKHGVQVFVDDKADVRESIQRQQQSLSAIDLANRSRHTGPRGWLARMGHRLRQTARHWQDGLAESRWDRQTRLWNDREARGNYERER